MADEPLADAGAAVDPSKSKLEKAAQAATVLLRHKELIVAAMEVLREQKAISEEEEVKLVTAYEQGSETARSAIRDVLERLQSAKMGKVVVSLREELGRDPITPEKIQGVAQPYIAAAKQTLSAEARPYLEKAKQRLAELKVLEEPTIRRLETVSENLKLTSREVVAGLKGVGREAADEIIRRGKRVWMSAETEELEREFFDWTLKNLPKAEQMMVRILLGFGLLLLLTGVLVAAQELQVLEKIAIYGAIFLLIFLGLAFLNWGIKLGEAIKAHQSDIDRLAKMGPAERRVYLTKRWAVRAEAEGLITATEAKTVIEETIGATAQAAEESARPPSSSS